MPSRIEIISKIPDMRAEVRKTRLLSMGFNVRDLRLVDVYTIDDIIPEADARVMLEMLANPVTAEAVLNLSAAPKCFDYSIHVSFLPGVTDNGGDTARGILEDRIGKTFKNQSVYSSQIMFLSGDLDYNDVVKIGQIFSNRVIQSICIKSYRRFCEDGGIDTKIPKVKHNRCRAAEPVEILSASDEKLAEIGKQGIKDRDGNLRGPLSMDLTYMKAVQNHFKFLERNPTDVELESIAQTWSEHCKHTIFAEPIDEFEDGLYKTFIKGATEKIRKDRGNEGDFCFSVFTDNAGAIEFDEEFLVCDKVETHNSPSALAPYGGAMTGIVGVNRDAMGFGMGAKPVINRYGFCFAPANGAEKLYKGKNKKHKMLSPGKIMDGVINGVKVGGNCSGIPTNQGFVFFDRSYRGKPLVFVGTVGLIPKEKNGRKLYQKRAMPGDYVVMAGGRVGKDGIHGATFSSVAVDSASPATAVQIGDPITQKKMSDAIVKEARDRGLYNSITDNGAGGLSCSVAEMAQESGGCHIHLDKVPLKYPGLASWEIWISESQERMTLAIPPEKWNEFRNLMLERDVEATVIGNFTDSGNCVVEHGGKKVMDLNLDFLHNGLPPRPIKTSYVRKKHDAPNFKCPEELTDSLHIMLERPNIKSFEHISRQYDHEVQGGSVIKPLQGKGRVNGEATVTRPKTDSLKAVVMSQGMFPFYGDIDTYDMAACAIDMSIRNVVAAGANIDRIALLDNFCWSNSEDPESLGRLKRACRACYDYATAFGTPFISGKDSMFNDFEGFDESGNPVKVSALPTLLISSLGVINDARKAVSIDFKCEGDLIYIIGATRPELGGSEYFAMMGEREKGERYRGNQTPEIDAKANHLTYRAFHKAVENDVVASAASVGRGGLGVALAKSAIAGQMGLDLDMGKIPGKTIRDDYSLYSESGGRLIVTVDPEKRKIFEELFADAGFAVAGKIRGDNKFRIFHGEETMIETDVDRLSSSYRA